MTSPPIEKPSVDEREYRHFVLGEDMDVLLISDPTTDKASAACDVYVGQLCDTLPGLAHFCEHMLFIGTEKYPTENAYDQYLSTHGGSSNAFTDLEHTCYYFDVQAESLEGALDRFAQCFIGPLFTQSALEREVQAVDSEHAKNIQQDPWRMYQLSKAEISDPKHMFASFGTGNQESLPKEGIREKVLDFYEKNYRRSLSLYKLVVLGKESLDDLQKMVHDYFDDLVQTFDPEGKQQKEERGKVIEDIYSPMTSWQVPKRLHVVPVGQVHSVDLKFPMPPILTMYKSKPTRYLSHLIGHEGKGSLLSCLKSHNYAQELYSDDQSVSCSNFSIFTIHVELTDAGLEQIDNVVDIIFAFIDLLRQKKPQEWIQDELKTVGDLQFKFLSKRNPMDYTCSLAGWMQHYQVSHYLSGAYKFYDWDPKAVTECLTALTPQNMLMTLSSPTFAGSTSSKCHWYTTDFDTIDIDQSLWDRWSNTNYSDWTELALPEINDMIATDFDILDASNFVRDRPQCILNTKTLRLWYKPDNVFDMPKVNIMISLASKHTASSPKESVAMNLFSKIIEEQCNEFTYLASMAALHSDISSTSTAGLEVHVSGYQHKAHILLARVVDTLVNLSEIDSELFSRICKKLEQQYDAFLVSQPYQHAINGGDLCLEYVKFTVFDKMSALKNITSEEVLQASKNFFKHCNVEALVHGNVTAQHAKEMGEMVLKKVKGETFDEGITYSSVERRVVDLPTGTCLYRFPEYNDANTNSCLEIILQMGPMTLEDNATLAFLHHLIKEPAFNQLRTEEQLGYIVHTSVKTSGNDIKGLLFLIQSDSFDPIHVESRVEEFIANFRERITSMTQEEFDTNVDSLVSSFLEKNKNLGEESTRYWHVILNQTYHFTRLQEIAEYIKVMTKDRVLAFFDKHVAASAPRRKKLCIQVFAKQHEERMNDKVPEDVILIESPNDFKQSMALFPLPKKVEIQVQQGHTEAEE